MKRASFLGKCLFSKSNFLENIDLKIVFLCKKKVLYLIFFVNFFHVVLAKKKLFINMFRNILNEFLEYCTRLRWGFRIIRGLKGDLVIFFVYFTLYEFSEFTKSF